MLNQPWLSIRCARRAIYRHGLTCMARMLFVKKRRCLASARSESNLLQRQSLMILGHLLNLPLACLTCRLTQMPCRNLNILQKLHLNYPNKKRTTSKINLLQPYPLFFLQFGPASRNFGLSIYQVTIVISCLIFSFALLTPPHFR